MIRLRTPLSHDDVMRLKTGDSVLLSGTLLTARDRAHVFLLSEDFPPARQAVIYHCGPVVKDGEVIAAGPTTSSRMNPYTPDLIKAYETRAIIGKGGMSEDVLAALRHRAVYLSAVGGAAVIYAKSMKVTKVFKEEFGMPEALWQLEVEDFPATVTMDAHGNSLHEKVRQESAKVHRELISPKL